MKTNRVYHSTIIGITSAIIGSTFCTNKVLAEELKENPNPSNKNQTIENASSSEKVNKVIVETDKAQEENQTTEPTSKQTNSDEDMIWEPAPPLTKAQDQDYDETSGNQTSNGVVKPHAQHTSKENKTKTRKSFHNSNEVTNSHSTSSAQTSQIKSQHLNSKITDQLENNSTYASNSSTNDNHLVSEVNTKQTEYKILPQTGEKDNGSIIIGTTMFLSSIGLLGVKKRKKTA